MKEPIPTQSEAHQEMEAHEDELKTQDPVVFPLEGPDEALCEALHKSWDRQQLARYLSRWEDAYIPEIPEGLWSFSWRCCDIGCGLGRFVLAQSTLYPQRAYLGIDKGTRRGGGMKRRTLEAGRSNLFGLHGNAIPLLAAMPPESFDLLTLFYPNPWWPSKHRKKRWAFHPILPVMIRLLKPGGTILLTSNERFYLSEWRYALHHHPQIQGTVRESYCGPIQVTEGRSHFEVKFLQHDVACGEVRFVKEQTG